MSLKIQKNINIYFKVENLVFATNNLHKLQEVRAILDGKVQIQSLSEIGCLDEIPETADTLEGNALLKAKFVYDRFQLDCFADDTGLEIEALGGEPGVFSARYAGLEHDSYKNRMKVLRLMEQQTNRKAQFRTVIALVLQGKEYLFEGKVEGVITREPRGEGGFGYDSIFVPNGYEQTFAELSAEQKNQISHRAHAVKKFADFIVSR
ncbi:MAG TPA: non-canonical purine NTP diphosphatase [Paludibacteraceae bacterium]|jgi:XTP/dITP diphosphohydrolase|nr:non-canonical purine NTP diphosphatase [Paludibacteraceae bacterium]HPQ13515.1 non-canonical purine NTP diphosphatase [Paludibacteraceae bacterium]